jgi:3-oxoacyl-[acyl-carrier protein] reductase
MIAKNMFDLSGKVALVTGGSRALGRQWCMAMAEFGADVACHYMTRKEGAEEVVDYARRLGRRAIAVQADVTKEDEVNRMAEQVINELGVIDIAFCSPAEPTPMQKLHEMPIEVWERCIMSSPNLKGALLCMRAVLPGMLAKKKGSIIVISTIVALKASMGEAESTHLMPAYHAAKAALHGLIKEAALEYATNGIRVNGIAPAAQLTVPVGDLSAKETLAFYNHIQPYIPMKRIAEEREITGLGVFLASDASSYITGYVFPHDGGLIV